MESHARISLMYGNWLDILVIGIHFSLQEHDLETDLFWLYAYI